VWWGGREGSGTQSCTGGTTEDTGAVPSTNATATTVGESGGFHMKCYMLQYKYVVEFVSAAPEVIVAFSPKYGLLLLWCLQGTHLHF
jgi:hypothetical protein